MTTRMLAAGIAAGLLAGSAAIAQTNTAAPAQAAAPAAGATTAATGAPLAQGSTVYDTQGGTVGTVDSVQGDFVVLATAKSKVRLPKASFGAGAKGPVLAMTAAQIDQAAAQAAPAQQTAATAAKPTIASGTQVTDTQGGAVGTVAEVDAQYATVQLTSGSKVRLPVSAFGAGPNGTARVAMTAAQLSAAAAAAGGSSSGG